MSGDLSLDDLIARIHGDPVQAPPREPRPTGPRKKLPREVELELVDAYAKHAASSDRLTETMVAARARGASLAEIGRACGMTRQAVHNRIKRRTER